MSEPRTLVITGAARGIGLATARAAASAGYTVAGIDVDEEAGSLAMSVLTAQGLAAHHYTCDVSNPSALDEVLARITSELGAIDALLNNAARGSHTPPEEMSPEEWHAVMDICLGSIVFASRWVGAEWIRTGHPGRIVNMSSIAGLAALGRGNYAYSIAKAGIVGLTRELAVEWAPFGIRVNALAPSQVNTEGFRPLIGDKSVAGGNTLGDAVSGIPMGRLAEPEEVASVIMFLLGNDSSFVTGVTLPVDGGSMALHAGGSMRQVD